MVSVSLFQAIKYSQDRMIAYYYSVFPTTRVMGTRDMLLYNAYLD